MSMEILFATLLVAILQIGGIMLTSMSGGSYALKVVLMRYKRMFDILLGIGIILWAGNRGISQVVSSSWAALVSTITLEALRCFVWRRWEERYIEECNPNNKKHNINYSKWKKEETINKAKNSILRSIVKPLDPEDLPYVGGTFFGIRIFGHKEVRKAQERDEEQMYEEW